MPKRQKLWVLLFKRKPVEIENRCERWGAELLNFSLREIKEGNLLLYPNEAKLSVLQVNILEFEDILQWFNRFQESKEDVPS